MLVALNKQDKRVHAFEATKDEKYYCPICKGEMILKDGEINIAHYAHRNNECADNWHYDMSEWHINKQSYFDEQFQEVVVTKNGVTHRADVLKDDVVIEFQHSSITGEEFNERNKFYISAGYKVVWVFDLTEQYENEQLYWDEYSENENMIDWKHPMRILKNTECPSRKNDVLICITWDNESEYEDIYRIDWSSTSIEDDDLGRVLCKYPNYQKIIVSEPYAMEKNMNLKKFFYSKSQLIALNLKEQGISYQIKKCGEKGFSREAYICPKTRDFGIRIWDKCQYCPHFYDYSKYGERKYNCYCCFPNRVNDKANMHP